MYGKAAKQRLVPINPTLRNALDQYLPARTQRLGDRKTDVLFFAVRERYTVAGQVWPIDVRNIHRMLLRICKLRGLEPMHRTYYVTPAQRTCWRTAARWT